MRTDAKYYLWMRQKGDGCDYTIACGEMLTPLKATTRDEANAEADVILGMGDPDFDPDKKKDRVMSEAIIIEAKDVASLNTELFYEKCRCRLRDAEAERKEAAERAKLEELRKKYGG